MGCRFSTGDVVLINDTAEVAFKYMGQTAIVMDTFLMGTGKKVMGESTPTKYDNMCLVTIQLEDKTILDNVPDSELSSI